LADTVNANTNIITQDMTVIDFFPVSVNIIL